MANATAPPATPVDAGATRGEISRLANGTRTWKVVVPVGTTEADMDDTKRLAVKLTPTSGSITTESLSFIGA